MGSREKGRNGDDKREGRVGSESERRKEVTGSEARIPRQVLRSGVAQQR